MDIYSDMESDSASISDSSWLVHSPHIYSDSDSEAVVEAMSAPLSEIANAIQKWQSNYKNSDYDPVPFLDNCFAILEKEYVEFQRKNPDPFDNRHAKYALPDCALGKMLTQFEDCQELMNELLSYLSASQTSGNNRATIISSAKLMLLFNKGHSFSSLDTYEWTKVFLDWMFNDIEPLATCASGLIDKRSISRLLSDDEVGDLISTLLKRLSYDNQAHQCDMPSSKLFTGCFRIVHSVDLLSYFGKFKQFLPIFLKCGVLPLILEHMQNAIDKSHTFEILRLLGSLLCHSVLTSSFIAMGGIETLLKIHNTSIAGAGVALCICNITFCGVEHITQQSKDTLSKLVKVVRYLSTSKHKSTRSLIAASLSLALSYEEFLTAFDDVEGLAGLIDMLRKTLSYCCDKSTLLYSVSPIGREASVVQQACSALKVYFVSSIMLENGNSIDRVTWKQTYLRTGSWSAQEYLHFFEVLWTLPTLSSTDIDKWKPILHFEKYQGMLVCVNVLTMAMELDCHEIGRSALDVLCIATLSSLCLVQLNNSFWDIRFPGSKDAGLSVIVRFLKFNKTTERRDSVAIEGHLVVTTLVVICNVVSKYGQKTTANQDYSDHMRILCAEDVYRTLISFLKLPKAPHRYHYYARYLSCRALTDMVNYGDAREKLSLFPEFSEGTLLSAFKEKVNEDVKQVNLMTCNCIEILWQNVTGESAMKYLKSQACAHKALNVVERLFLQQSAMSTFRSNPSMLPYAYNKFSLCRINFPTTLKFDDDYNGPRCVAFIPNSNNLVICGDDGGNIYISRQNYDEDFLKANVTEDFIEHMELTRSGEFLLTSGDPLADSGHGCSLIKMNDSFDRKIQFREFTFFGEFSKTVQDKIVVTMPHKVGIFDISSCVLLNAVKDDSVSSDISDSESGSDSWTGTSSSLDAATISCDDKLILYNGKLWDVRANPCNPVRYFDTGHAFLKHNRFFHPNGMEVVVNGAIYDLRTINRLKSNKYLEKHRALFNTAGSVIYAIPCDEFSSLFYTLCASTYELLGTFISDGEILDVAVDQCDHSIAVVEHLYTHGQIVSLFNIGVER